MSVAGLPGLPGGAALVPALDTFTGHVLAAGQVPAHEICGAFIYRHLEPKFDGSDAIEWIGEIDFVPLKNTSATPENGFAIENDELKAICEQELESLRLICEKEADAIAEAAGFGGPFAADLYRSGFSPFVGIGHSHPGGSILPSAADYRLAENATQWRRAAAPASMLWDPGNAKFFEADFLFAVHDLLKGHGTLVHFRKGLVRGEWEGNFRARVD